MHCFIYLVSAMNKSLKEIMKNIHKSLPYELVLLTIMSIVAVILVTLRITSDKIM